MKFLLNISLLLIAFAGMVNAQDRCTKSCPSDGPRICGGDSHSTTLNGGYRWFPNVCEMEKYNCQTGKRYLHLWNDSPCNPNAQDEFCTRNCVNQDQQICARDPDALFGANGGHRKFPSWCEMKKYNCLNGKQFYLVVKNDNCSV